MPLKSPTHQTFSLGRDAENLAPHWAHCDQGDSGLAGDKCSEGPQIQDGGA